MTRKEAERILAAAGINSPVYDARELLIRLGGISHSAAMLPDAASDAPAFLDGVKRRAAREPLQYILGEVGFFRETYEVTPACLIPRADTELLVETAIRLLPENAFFFDLCTGSGCVAISVLANRKDTTALAVDLSADALEVAKRNAIRNQVASRVDFLCADVLKTLPQGRPAAILANPPYVTEASYRTLAPEISHEPRKAFVGGEDGLDFYRGILSLYRDILAPDGFFAFEIGFDQGDALRALAAKHSLSCEILRDLSGNDRVALLR